MSLKSLLTHLGVYFSQRTVHRLNAVLNYVETGRWMHAHGFHAKNRFGNRYELYEHVAHKVAGKKVLYLEFGVHRGASIAYWSKLLTNPESQLHGFDSFEGLPEDWDYVAGAGHFSTNGEMPVIEDPRVVFFKGWFQDTLPTYQLPPHEQLIIHFDADLYSSTTFVLSHLRPSIAPNTILIFDEFADRLNELKAFAEFLVNTGAVVQLIGAERAFTQVAFEVQEFSRDCKSI
jgi:hypothetical protein